LDKRSTEFYFYLAQRISAMVLAPLVILHLITIIFISSENLTAGEILVRTQGSFFWACFYGLFVVAVSIHGAIGLRTVAQELLNLKRPHLDILAAATGLSILILGMRAIFILI